MMFARLLSTIFVVGGVLGGIYLLGAKEYGIGSALLIVGVFSYLIVKD